MYATVGDDARTWPTPRDAAAGLPKYSRMKATAHVYDCMCQDNISRTMSNKKRLPLLYNKHSGAEKLLVNEYALSRWSLGGRDGEDP